MRRHASGIIALIGFFSAMHTPAADLVRAVKDSGVKGGIIVHVGCGEGALTAQLLLNDRYLVHGLDTDTARIQAARRNLAAAGLYGKVSVTTFDGTHLPYRDNLVNMLVLSDPKPEVPDAELMRVLAPGGVVVDATGAQTRKPWPADIDEWNHFLHGPDNNAVAQDSLVGMPRSIQWVATPRWGRSHEEFAGVSSLVSSGGRVFYIVDEAPLASIRYLADWKLVARDAFNGTLLWKRDIPQWNDHLRHFRSGPAHLPRRLVAVGDRVYVTLGLAAPVAALDAATGKTLQTYTRTEHTEEILIENGVMYIVAGTSERSRRGGGLFERGEPQPSDFRYLAAVDVVSGKRVWQRDFTDKEFLLPLGLAVHGTSVVYQTALNVVCLDSATGNERWRTARLSPKLRMGYAAPTLVATDKVVLCADREPGDTPSNGSVEWGVHGWNESGFPRKGRSVLRAYSVQDGKELWAVPCNENYNSQVDVFVIDGLVYLSTDYKGYDLNTGEVKKEINVKGDRVGMAHHRCYRNKASERFIFLGRSGVELLDLEKKSWIGNNSWIRGTCQYGIMPANGLLYAPPDACGCFLTVKVPGLFAAAPAHSPAPRDEIVTRLEKGPAYGQPSTLRSTASEWPMYRHDAMRSGACKATIADAPVLTWESRIGGRLTQAISGGGTVYVASVDAHAIHALDAASGKETWRYIAGGRIDSAPTLYRGYVYFGCADGWVYALHAASGDLAWRFLAAPRDQLAGVYGQLESTWPVHGAVVIQNDELFATAGRSTYLDGGIRLYRIHPQTGHELSQTTVCHIDPETDRQSTPESGFNMEGTLTDVLTGDGERVYLKYFAFDRHGKRTSESKPHLFAIAGLLGEEWFVRSYWTISTKVEGAGWGGWAATANKHHAGRLLCFNTDKVYGYGREKVAGGPTGHKADTYHLFCSPLAPPPPASEDPAPGSGKKKVKKSSPPPKTITWSNPESLIVRAMVVTDDKVLIAGPPDLGKREAALLAYENEREARAAFGGEKGVFLRVLSAADGKQLSEHQLDAMPTFDGMSAAGGHILISLRTGTLQCWQ